MAKFKPLPPLAELEEAFAYDPETGLFTHRKTKYRVRQGDAAGTYHRLGYLMLTMRPHRMYGQRVAWYMGTGEDPLQHNVDHIDRDPSNNCLSNLRLCNQSQNVGNALHRGYYYRKDRGYYVARLYHRGGVVFLGNFLKVEDAERAYREKAVELRGEFAPQEWKKAS